MAFKIGFMAEHQERNSTNNNALQQKTTAPRKSLVQVHFPKRGMTCTYYNDSFDLHVGDLVFVDGKLEGVPGRVTSVNYTFKIKLSDYHRVISVADTEVHGQLHMAESHFVAFASDVVPAGKIRTWFLPPVKDEEEIISGSDDTSFTLEDFKGLKISKEIVERGHDYYLENRVRYLCIDGERGYAIVEGTEPYEVEFEYASGEIRNMTCTCFCSYNCKHEFAAILLLKELLENIDKHYATEYERTGYFAAISKTTLFAFAIDGKETGSFTL